MSLEQIYNLQPEQSELLYSDSIENQRIEVREWTHYRWLHIAGESVQALIDLNDAHSVVLPNIRTLLLTLLLQPDAKKLLNLGLGGASIERYLRKYHSSIEVKSIEANAKVIELAKEYFKLPPNSEIINSTAADYFAKNRTVYDIILCDIFEDEQQPACLYDQAFYKNLDKSLSKTGSLAINLLPESEEDVIQLILPMKGYFDHISLLEIDDHTNVVIFACRQSMPDPFDFEDVA
mgnify:CR=1 FL=1